MFAFCIEAATLLLAIRDAASDPWIDDEATLQKKAKQCKKNADAALAAMQCLQFSI